MQSLANRAHPKIGHAAAFEFAKYAEIGRLFQLTEGARSVYA